MQPDTKPATTRVGIRRIITILRFERITLHE